MFGQSPEKKAIAKKEKEERKKLKRIMEAEKPRDANRTFRRVLLATGTAVALAQEPVREAGAAVLKGFDEAVNGQPLLTDLPKGYETADKDGEGAAPGGQP